MFNKRKDWTSKLSPFSGKKGEEAQSTTKPPLKEPLPPDPPAYYSSTYGSVPPPLPQPSVRPVPQPLPLPARIVPVELDSREVASVPPLPWHHQTPLRESSSGQFSFSSIDARIGSMIRVLQPLEERRARLLRAQLISVQSRISSWSRERDIDTVTQLEDLLQRIPSVTRDTMLEICERLREWLASPQKSVLVQEPGSSSTAKMVFLETMVDGYDTLETLRSVSNGLYNLVPFLSSRGVTMPRPGSSVTTDMGDNVSAISERGSLSQSQSDVSRAESQIVPQVQFQTDNPTEQAVPVEKLTSIQILYSKLLRALQTVVTQLDDKELANTLCSRMVVWGCGLFQTTKPLDLILEQNEEESTVEFRTHIVGVLSDIAVIIAIVLQNYDDSPDPDVQRSLNGLEACFGKFKEFNEEAMEDGPDLPDPNESDDREAFSQICVVQVNGLVDCLFEVLPAIDRLRQVWILDLEKRSREFASSLAAISAAPSEVRTSVNAQSLADRTNISENYPPSQISRSSNYDEIDFTGQPSDATYFGKGKGVVPISAQEVSSSKEGGLFRRHQKGPKSFERKNNFEHQSLQDIVVMDLELATAMRLSLLEAQTQAAQEKRVDAAVLAELEEWDEEISRLKHWSEVFEMSLGPTPSEAETNRLHSILQQLAKVARAFVGANPKSRTGTSNKDTVEVRLERAATVISKSKHGLFDTKVELEKKTYGEALQTFREANNCIHDMGMENMLMTGTTLYPSPLPWGQDTPII